VASCNCIEILGFEKRERKILGLEKKWYYEGEIFVLAEVMTPEAKASSQRVCTSLLILMTKKKERAFFSHSPWLCRSQQPGLSSVCSLLGQRSPMSWMKPSNDASFFITKKLSIMLTHDSLRKSSAASSHLVLCSFLWEAISL
jgi:hypothetical protein